MGESSLQQREEKALLEEWGSGSRRAFEVRREMRAWPKRTPAPPPP
jgi:hypothetical protein